MPPKFNLGALGALALLGRSAYGDYEEMQRNKPVRIDVTGMEPPDPEKDPFGYYRHLERTKRVGQMVRPSELAAIDKRAEELAKTRLGGTYRVMGTEKAGEARLKGIETQQKGAGERTTQQLASRERQVGVQAGATRYASEKGLEGRQAQAGATVKAAEVRSAGQESLARTKHDFNKEIRQMMISAQNARSDADRQQRLAEIFTRAEQRRYELDLKSEELRQRGEDADADRHQREADSISDLVGRLESTYMLTPSGMTEPREDLRDRIGRTVTQQIGRTKPLSPALRIPSRSAPGFSQQPPLSGMPQLPPRPEITTTAGAPPDVQMAPSIPPGMVPLSSEDIVKIKQALSNPTMPPEQRQKWAGYLNQGYRPAPTP